MIGEPERRVLVDQAVPGAPVDPDRASVDDARAGGASGLEHRQRATRIDLLGVHGLLRDDADVRVGRQVDDRLAVLHRDAERLLVEEVADDGVYRSGLVMRGLPQVVDPRLVPSGGELVDYVRADEARAPGDEDPG